MYPLSPLSPLSLSIFSIFRTHRGKLESLTHTYFLDFLHALYKMKRLYPDGCGLVVKQRVETVYKGKRGGIFYKNRSGNKTYIKHDHEPIYTCECYHNDANHPNQDSKESSSVRKEPRVLVDEQVIFDIPSVQVLTEDSILIPLFVSCQQICQHIEHHLLHHANIERMTVRVLHISDIQKSQLQHAIELRFRSCFPIIVI